MGLASVYGCVKNHKGHINVYSEKGKGSVFHIYLPLVADKEKVLEVKKYVIRKKSVGTGHVFIIDDEPAVRVVCQRMLNKIGYKVIVYQNGPQ